jgi:hypothetical protein
MTCPVCDNKTVEVEFKLNGGRLRMRHCSGCDLHSWDDGSERIQGTEALAAFRRHCAPRRGSRRLMATR